MQNVTYRNLRDPNKFGTWDENIRFFIGNAGKCQGHNPFRDNLSRGRFIMLSFSDAPPTEVGGTSVNGNIIKRSRDRIPIGITRGHTPRYLCHVIKSPDDRLRECPKFSCLSYTCSMCV